MHPLFNISSVSLLAGLLFLLQASFNHAWGSSKPPASPQEPQTFILPLYLKSTPLSEKRQVFRKSLPDPVVGWEVLERVQHHHFNNSARVDVPWV